MLVDLWGRRSLFFLRGVGIAHGIFLPTFDNLRNSKVLGNLLVLIVYRDVV